jgi:hypothetical protein
MFSVTMVRLLKGAPLACLVALMIAQQEGLGAQGAEWLERATGYTFKPVNQALQFLEDQGLVTRNGRFLWQLAGEIKQFPLSLETVPASRPEAGPTRPGVTPSKLGASPSKLGASPSKLGAGNRVGKIPTPLSSSSSGFIDILLRESTSTSELEKFQLPVSPQSGECDTPRIGECLADIFAALDAAGIREPARSRLAGLGHVTAELVEKVGQAIYRIENNGPVKGSGEEDRRRYVEGRFAEFVKH